MALPVSLEFPLSVRAVMIDLDGTLLDTIPDLAIAANEMLAAMKRPALDVDLIRSFVGKGIAKLVEKTLAATYGGDPAPEQCEAALVVFERCYTVVNGRHTAVYPGVFEGLKQMRDMELPLACVTNKAGRFTKPLMDRMRLAPYFSQVVAGDTLPRKKPDPMPLLHVCEKLGIAPADMLMIGDSLNDAQAARAAGCPVFCVNYGYNEGHDVRALDIDAIVPSLFEATRLIRKR
jgi:phosphoglycolate phosphatase